MASLLEQYEQLATSSGTAAASMSSSITEAQTAKNEGIINLRTVDVEPIFARNKIDFKPPHPITHMVVSSNQLLMAMENRTLIKIDLMDSKKIDIDLNLNLSDKTKPTAISGIFIDPTGRHCIISTYLKAPSDPRKSDSSYNQDLGSQLPYENFYYNKKLHKLTKLNGFVITAVGWNSAAGADPSGSTGNILIGTSDGRIFETVLQPDDRFLGSKELFLKQVTELPDNGTSSGNQTQQQLSGRISPSISASSHEPICAINVFKVTGNRSNTATVASYCILVATRNFLYQFFGELSASMASTTDSPYLYQIVTCPSTRTHKEMPGYLPTSRLDLFYPPPATGSAGQQLVNPKAFGWLTKPSIFYNEIPNDLSPANSSRLFDDASLIMLNDLASSTNSAHLSETPLSLVLTKFHILLLYPSMLKIICVLNETVIHEESFSSTYGRVLGLCRDPIRGAVWMYTELAVYRYKITLEDRNIWEIYLKKKDFDKARLYAGNDVIKQDRTVCEEALHYFSRGDFKASAQLFAFAKSKTFEEIALKFIELRDKDQEALKEYLLCKLSTLSPVKERTQIIILLLWLFEILLNQLGSLANQMEDAELSKEEVLKMKVQYNKIETSLKDLLSNSNFKACLKKNRSVIYNLILNHSNSSILIYFAEHIDDFERLLDHYLQLGDYDQALTILRKEECLTLYYRYSPTIVQERPRELVAQLMPLAGSIDFAKLIPALVHFDNAKLEEETGRAKREVQCLEILRFLEYCVFNLQTDSSLVHNYLIALYAQYQPDKLLTYLQLNGNGADSMDTTLQTSAVPYDVRYAARLCTQLGLGQATVYLLATMGAIEEAVEQALAYGDIELAKQTAEKVSTVQKPELAKRLWLKIAKYVIKKSSSESGGEPESFNMKMATNILNECPLLKIEDILPYFPAFSTIDHFKDAICSSLEEYNRTIETLREDMSVATESAQEIREEIGKLRNRYTIISASDKCELCEYFVLTKPFYSFHCGHLFHSDCLLDEIRPHLPAEERRKLEKLEKKLMKSIVATANPVPSGNSAASLANASTSSGPVVNLAPVEGASVSETNQREEIYAAIDDIVASECFYCGHYMISTIDKPFIDPEETNALKGWD